MARKFAYYSRCRSKDWTEYQEKIARTMFTTTRLAETFTVGRFVQDDVKFEVPSAVVVVPMGETTAEDRGKR